METGGEGWGECEEFSFEGGAELIELREREGRRGSYM